MKDIVLAGVSLSELAATKLRIQPAAAAFISDSIDSVKSMVRAIERDAETAAESETEVDKDALQAVARDALMLLEQVELVSGVAGIEYDLPTYRYSERRLSSILDDTSVMAGSWRNPDDLYRLYDKLTDMENTVEQWNASTC